MQDSEQPESFLRRLLWKNSGILCLATLITLPIILGVALGYVIVLAFVTSYRKITGKKSREEKENEAAKKIRIVLGQDLLDTAFTKPEELPGQRPKFIRPPPRYGSVNDDVLSSDESESESETEGESVEEMDERLAMENRSEKEDLHEKMETCVEVGESENLRPQAAPERHSANDVTGDGVIGGSRTTSASSGNYSTASEMTGRDSRETNTSALDTRNIDTAEETYQDYVASSGNAPGQNSSGHDALSKTVPDVASPTISDREYSEGITAAVHPVNPVSGLNQTSPAINSNILDSGSENEKRTPAVHSVVMDSGIKNISSIKNDSKASSHKIEIPPVLGKLKYSVHYIREKNELQVTITKAINLFSADNETPPSSFVKVSLLPQRFCWQKTKIVERTAHPVFNETFVISGFSYERFSNYTLLISVVNAATSWQGFYGDHVIGEVYVPLYHVAKYSSNQDKVFSQWADLKSKITEMRNVTKCGRINLALCYRPISGRLIVTIKKAKELECEGREKFDSYVKLALYCGGSRVDRGSTRVKRKVSSPVFNEKFNFDLNADQIAYTTIVLKVMNSIDSNKSSCIGATVIGYESSENGQEHWMCMMKCLSKHVEAWHNLYT
ncbi:synaptotagmin-4-like isoform X2 [Dendronephthya gigantea]|uniref:synaptotagmin-4-like isoform X2 n=1 Tax=Dendronephthya gigantea TaxID=151771 RepID=UPI00106B9D4F|nr:synaptotagmin-4-like isoform X2 [Dendronephthya gigantea]XP_028406881.1 synaptotagmin-4-like isoform X2 [Dendronephthya gigantea]XP_028406882.1 synaptotagmin-4-like isoform X2 [Dendronephthya gigantea]